MIAPIKPAKGKANSTVYQLKVVLDEVEPPIMRRLQVPSEATLGWLHAVLQVAVGWTNSHLHHFEVGKERYADPQHNEFTDFGGEPDLDETKAVLVELLPQEGARMTYEYDFGDSWRHTISVEKILSPDPALAKKAVCVEGARSCPPEDCGGTWGYGELLEALKDPKHEEHDSMLEWIGGEFDSEACDLEKINAYLGKLKWPRATENQLRKVLMDRDGFKE